MTVGGGWGEGGVQIPNGEDRLALAVRFWWGEGGSPNRRAAERPGPRRSASEGGTHTRRDSGAHGRSRTRRGWVGRGAHRVLAEADTGAPRPRAEGAHLTLRGTRAQGRFAFPENRGVSHTHTHTQRSPGSKDLGPRERRLLGGSSSPKDASLAAGADSLT